MSRASAPASSANLGPGFDVVAVALPPRCAVVAERSREWELISPGLDDPSSAVHAAFSVAEDLECEGPWRLEVDSAIPVGRGLGSSAAFVVAAGAAMLDAAGKSLDVGALLAAGAGAEGHADNVAAAVHGGLVAVAPDGNVARLEMHPEIEMLLAIPDRPLSTNEARRALPPEIARGVATRSVARAIMLAEALRRGDARLGASAGGDELHEEPRADLSPLTAELVEAARTAGAIHASWSGAGPSAIAFVRGEVATDVQRVWSELVGSGGRVQAFSVERRGVEVG